MLKSKSICMVLACSFVTVCAFSASAGLPTMDPGNIAGTIGIVSEGAQGLAQGVKNIANGSMLNAVLGDSAGSLMKFVKNASSEIQKGVKAAQDAQKRISDGVNTYNKYKNEIESRKAEYQAMLDTVKSKVGITDSYDDSEDEALETTEEQEYTADYDGGYDVDYDAEATSTLEIAAEAATENLTDVVPSPELQMPAEEVEDAVMAESYDAPVKKLDKKIVEDVLETKALLEVLDEKVAVEKEIDAKALKLTPVQKELNTPSITNETLGRRRFGETAKTLSENAKTLNVSTTASEIKQVTPLKSTMAPMKIEKNTIAVETPVALEKATAVEKPATRQFRVSPKLKNAEMKIERVSHSTINYSSPMMFASQSDDTTKGVNYDSKGTFISPLAQRCGMSISDLQDRDKVQECTAKIVSENYAENQYDALNSRKDCNKMIHNTVVALLAEATDEKYEASNYSDTLDKQEKLGGDSNTVRDDSSLLALTNQQTQILLNRMSLLLSAQIILDSVQQLCDAPKDVLSDSKEAGTEKTDGGK